MHRAFTRIMLALITAFVFVGQMEAAAAHCAQLAQTEAAIAAPADEADCHGMSESAATGHHSTSADTPEAPRPDQCDCIAALKVCATPADMPGSTRIAPYAWLLPEAASFASIVPAPGLRPPRI